MTKEEALSVRLREGMYKARINQRELAKRSGTSAPNISCYLSRKYYPKYGTLISIALALGVEPDWLEGRDLWNASEMPSTDPVLFELSELEKAVVSLMRTTDYGTQARILAAASDLVAERAGSSGYNVVASPVPGGPDFVLVPKENKK